MTTESNVVRISHDLYERLDVLAERTGRSKTHYASKAIAEYLDDREDYLLGIAAYEESKGKRGYSLEEVTRQFEMAGRGRAASAQGDRKPRAR